MKTYIFHDNSYTRYSEVRALRDEFYNSSDEERDRLTADTAEAYLALGRPLEYCSEETRKYAFVAYAKLYLFSRQHLNDGTFDFGTEQDTYNAISAMQPVGGKNFCCESDNDLYELLANC